MSKPNATGTVMGSTLPKTTLVSEPPTPSRAAWRRDVVLYAVIGALTAYQSTTGPLDSRQVAGIILAACIAGKAKLSNGKPKEGEGE